MLNIALHVRLPAEPVNVAVEASPNAPPLSTRLLLELGSANSTPRTPLHRPGGAEKLGSGSPVRAKLTE
jgi:hypothetical protein